MFRSIVWGTDGSTESDRALATVMRLGTEPSAKVTVVHVDEHFRGSRVAGEPVLANESDLRKKIEGQLAELRAAGIDAQVEFLTRGPGEPADTIAQVAHDVGADVIVVGTRGHGRIAGALLGSVAQRLLHVAPCLVLVVPPGARVEQPEHAIA